MSSERYETDARADGLIDVQQMGALSYWTRRLSVSERELKDAVEAVGPQPTEVSRYLSELG